MLHVEEEFDIEYAASLAARSLELMAKNGISATPANFTLWFNYALGAFPSLSKTMNTLLANKRKFDHFINRDLFSTFVKEQVGPVDGGAVSSKINNVIVDARNHLTVAIADSRTQIEALDQVSRDVCSGQDTAATIKRLQNELREATIRATTTEAKLADSSAELERIKESLAEAEIRSKTDALTGLANRHMLDATLRSSLIVAMERGTPLCVFMADIDHFKKFNDQCGHQVGDQVLRLVAKTLQAGVRSEDLAARYGGEELMAILPGADLRECLQVAERVRMNICRARLTRRSTGEEIGMVTVSIGATQFALGESLEALIQRCDAALYQAKRAGRNRTVAVDELDVPLLSA